jgi:Family of unknown function (DUF6069)
MSREIAWRQGVESAGAVRSQGREPAPAGSLTKETTVKHQLLQAQHQASPQPDTVDPETGTVQDPAERRLRRAQWIVAAAVAASAIYLTASGTGVRFDLTDPGKTQPMHLTLPVIISVALFFALSGWAALAALERYRPRRARTAWRTLAVTVLLLSYAPIGIEHAAASTKILLVIIHTTVAAVLLQMARPAPGTAPHRLTQSSLRRPASRITTAGLLAGQARRSS